MLIQILRNKEEEWIVRTTCYDSIMNIIGITSAEIVNKGLGAAVENDINWDYIGNIEKTILKKSKKN